VVLEVEGVDILYFEEIKEKKEVKSKRKGGYSGSGYGVRDF